MSSLHERYCQRTDARLTVHVEYKADDVVQDSLVKIYAGLSGFRGEANLSTWIYRIAMNLSLNALRKKRLRTMLHLDELEEEPAAEEEGSDIQVLRQEYETMLRRAVELLPAKQKMVFILRYYEDLSYGEIAAILKKSEGGLKANYFHAVQKIEQSMKREMS